MHYKRWFVLPVLYISCYVHAENIGLIGGQVSAAQGYAALVTPTGGLTPFNFGFTINDVAINSFAQGLIGGQDLLGNPSAAFISPTGVLTSFTIGTIGSIQSVAINDSGQGLIGGISNGIGFAATLSATGSFTSLNPGINGSIQSVAINSSSQGLIGGIDGVAPYAASVTPTNQITTLNLGFSSGIINSVAINNSSLGLIGGQNFNNGNAYAAFITPTNQVTASNLGISIGKILSVAINDSSQGLVGGQKGTALGPAYAAFVSETQTIPLTLGLSQGIINDVAINQFNHGLIGGQNIMTAAAYAALVFPSGQVTPLTLAIPNGIINSVAINDYDQGLIGGRKGSAPYAALISPTGQVIPLNLGFSNGNILSVAILSRIPIETLSQNSLAFANYINKNAPYNAFYFAPDYFAGTLEDALKSAAPTRNIISLFTADNNLFFLDSLLSNHCRNARHIRRQIRAQHAETLAHLTVPSDRLFAFADETLPISTQPDQDPAYENTLPPRRVHEKPYEIWGTPFGALAYQKKQHQTPAFNPTTGGIILGFDGKVETHTRVGSGAAYTYTYIHEKEDAGHSRINQEYLLLYTSWDNRRFYFDTALWAGLFQIENVRKIHMTAFEFRTKAHPKGWQLSPHLELGYDFNSQSSKLTTEPFVIFDWINNWQKAHKEHGSGPFNAGHKRHHSSFLRSETGVRVYETFRFDSWNFVIQEKISYVNKKPFKVGRIKAFLIGAPGTFIVETLTTTQNLGVAELEFIFQPHNLHYPRATLQYQGEFGSMYQSHLASLELTWKF